MPRAFTLTDVFHQLNSDIQGASQDNTVAGSIELQTILVALYDVMSISDMTSTGGVNVALTASSPSYNWDATTWGQLLWS